MNIFASHECPKQSALWLDDIRKNKMIVESAQMLSTAMNILDPGHGRNVYKNTHPNHPSNVWVRESSYNFSWLCRHMGHMINQRGKPHKSSRVLDVALDWWDDRSDLFPTGVKTPFANCAAHKELRISFKHIRNVHVAYRMYLDTRWSMDTIQLTWKHGEDPWWRHK